MLGEQVLVEWLDSDDENRRFDALALERLARETPGVFVADEAYADFAAQTMIPFVGEVEGFCVMRSLSKIGLAALRVGALIGPADLVAQLDKVRLPYNVNAVSMALACARMSPSCSVRSRTTGARTAPLAVSTVAKLPVGGRASWRARLGAITQ